MTTPKNPQPLQGGAQAASVTLVGGAGIAAVGPKVARQHWQINSVGVKVSTNTAEAMCSIYIGTTLQTATFYGTTFTGSSGDNIPIGNLDIQPGMQVFAQWSGGDSGSVATLTVFGTYTAGAPNQTFLGAVGSFANKLLPIFKAGNLIINKSGIFLYNGTPALGNPPFAYIKFPTVSVDPVGNPVLMSQELLIQGNTSVAGGGPPNLGVNFVGSTIFENISSGAASEKNPLEITTQVSNANTANEQIAAAIIGPSNTTNPDHGQIQMGSSTANTGGIAGLSGQYVDVSGTDHVIWTVGANGFQRLSLAGMQGCVPLILNDNFSRTVTFAAAALTFGYSIPANDVATFSNQQTVYRLRAWGNGTQSNPATTGNFSVKIFGVNVYVSVLFSPAPAAANFTWYFDAWVLVNSNGTNQSAVIGGLFASAGNTAQITISGSAAGMNTTVASDIELDWGWNANNGQSITCIGSVFTREGP